MTSTSDVADERRPSPMPSLASLRAALAGTIHTPEDPEYPRLVAPWNLAVPVHPRAAVAVRTPEDVARVIRFARANGLTVGAQGTGHGAYPGLAGDLLISTRRLDEVTAGPGRHARVGAGVRWRRLAAAAPRGLAPIAATASTVGVVGTTISGGVGPMARSYGLSSDHVHAFEVVTGDGVHRRATAAEEPDLFLALRGGKGTAGVVTAVELDLARRPGFYGGALYFDGADAARVVAAWQEWSAALPDDATTSFALLRLPALTSVARPLVGRLTVAVRFAWTGSPSVGEERLDAMRAVAPVLVDDAAPRPTAELDRVHAVPMEPLPLVDPAMLLDGFPPAAADRLLAVAGPDSDSSLLMVEVRQLGGAYARPAEHPDAFSHRTARYSALAVGMAPDPRSTTQARAVLAALTPWDTGGVWPSSAAVVGIRTARRAYDPTSLLRLVHVARAYDPDAVLEAGRWTLAA